MFPPWRRLFLAVMMAGLIASSAGPAARAETRILRNYTVEDGLTQIQAVTVAEDHDGYLWIGTADGLSRFDGNRFTNFQTRDGLPAGRVFAIHPARNGDLLFGTENGLAVWRGGRFVDLPLDSPLREELVQAIAEAPDGRLLFTRRQRVDVLFPHGRVAALPLGPLAVPPKAVLVTRGGTVLVGGDSVLYEVRGTSVRRLGPEDGVDGEVLALRQARNGLDERVWVGTAGGLSIWRPGGRSLQRGPEIAGVRQAVQAIEEGSDGALYLGTADAGLLVLRPEAPGVIDAVTTDEGLLWNNVHGLRETRGGAIYLATDRGLSVYSRDVLRTWTREDGLPDLVWTIAHDPGRGGTWLGTDHGLVFMRHGEVVHRFDHRDGLPHDVIRSLLLDRTGRLWIGTQKGGVAILDAGAKNEMTGRLRLLGRREGLPDLYVRALLERPDGAVWMGTQRGVAIWRDGRIRILDQEHGLPDRVITSLASGPDGSVLVGTQGGLAQVSGGAENLRVRSWLKSDGLADRAVWSVRAGRDGTLWAGTVRGLSRLDKGRFRTIGTRSGLSNDMIYCMEEDALGRLYVSTGRGVNILDFGGGRFQKPSIRILRRPDGLGSDEGNLGSCRRDPAGRIWFGNVAGVSVYDPARDLVDHPVPRVHISALRLFGEELPLPQGPRVFRSHENYFELSFVGIDLASPHSVRYRYRLAGLDRDWIDSERREVQYTNLDPGDYRFEVQAASAGGAWSEPAVLGFTIETPLWRRWWFVLLTLLAAAAFVGWLFTLRVRQLLAIERLRTAIAADLHDHIGAGLTEIAILSEIAAHRAHQQASPPPELSRVADTARQLVDRMNDIVWLVNPRRDSLHELFLRLKDSYAELFSHAGVLFRTTNLRLFENVRLPMDYRQNLYLIFKEALHNSLRHSGCQEIELSVAVRGRRLEVVLRDDGRGFDPAGGSAGNGLENMRTRASRIGGALRIDAAPDRGTSVRFEGPLA
jgi:ligand-binding sensor domain-containing protein